MSDHMRAFVEALKILALCIVAAVVYGILHDIVTIHICPLYFTVYHPRVFQTQNLWLLALGWGTIATWWMGYFLGIPIALSAVMWREPRLRWRQVAKPLAFTLVGCYVLAALFGTLAYRSPQWFAGKSATLLIPGMETSPDFLAHDRRYMAVYVAHNVSYDAGTLGGALLCVWLIRTRIRTARAFKYELA